MRRLIYSQLLKWKNSPNRKPLMMYGARQVGKTYILKEFGTHEFKNLVYINCHRNDEIKILFSGSFDTERIIIGLSAFSGIEIEPTSTLIFFDEVQEIPDIVSALKYFQEDAPQYYIAVAGSLLGVLNMKNQSFPVGKVNIMHLFPMVFTEFLEAMGEEKKAELLYEKDEKEIIDALSTSYKDLLRQYYFVGGMPEAVKDFAKHHDPLRVREIQNEIIAAYESDIAKHTGGLSQKCRMVFESMPSQLAKENKKFVYGVVKEGARARDLEDAIIWLKDAGLIYQVFNVSKPGYPLSFYFLRNSFKVYLLDVGLLGAMGKVSPSLILIGDQIFSEYKGAFSENFVITQLIAMKNISTIGYYSKEGSKLEVDFVVQAEDKIIPIEVKAEENVKAKSLRQFICNDFPELHLKGVRFSMKGFADQEWMENIPLYAVSTLGSKV